MPERRLNVSKPSFGNLASPIGAVIAAEVPNEVISNTLTWERVSSAVDMVTLSCVVPSEKL